MFSGIIEQIAKIDKLINTNKDSHIILELDLSKVTLSVGDSVAINGVCLTVSSMENKFCRFDISPETLKLTAFKDLNPNDLVNIEFPLTLNKFISGHITTGHVDSIGVISSVKKIVDSWEILLEVEPSTLKNVIHKGSITVDGVSLTVNDISDNIISLMIIPHTYQNTIIKNYKVGQKVNIEVDYISKHLEKLKND